MTPSFFKGQAVGKKKLTCPTHQTDIKLNDNY